VNLRPVAVALLLATALVLQTAVFPALTLLGFRPDLLLLVVVGVAVHDGPPAGVRVGAVAGLLADLLVVQASAGVFVLVYGVVGYAVGQVRPYLAPHSLSAPTLVAFVASVAGTAAYGVFTGLLADRSVPWELVVQVALAVGLYNALLSPGVNLLVGALVQRYPLRGTATD